MKIELNTVNVLKNFAKINPSILIQEGNTLKTMSVNKTILAKVKIGTKFDKRFAIYNLDRFISTLSLFNDPDLKFEDKFVTITDSNKKIKYTYADENTIKAAPDKEITLPSVDVTCEITAENLKDIEKAAGVLGLPEILIIGNIDGKIYLQAADVKNPSGDVYSIELGSTDKEFTAVFKIENIKVIPGNYTVELCSRGISRFKSDTSEYFIAVEATSTFK